MSEDGGGHGRGYCLPTTLEYSERPYIFKGMLPGDWSDNDIDPPRSL
jgi:hypothetical protein